MKKKSSEGVAEPTPLPRVKLLKSYKSAYGIYSGLSPEWNRLEIRLNASRKLSRRKRWCFNKWGKDDLFNKWRWAKGSHLEKNEVGATLHTRTNSREIKHFKVKNESIYVPKESLVFFKIIVQ